MFYYHAGLWSRFSATGCRRRFLVGTCVNGIRSVSIISNYQLSQSQLNSSLFEKQEIRFVELRVCPMQLFHFWSRDVHPVQNLLLCTKFHENPMIFTRDAMHISVAYAVMWCLSVCVCLSVSRSCIVLKRIKISSNFFYRRVATLF